MQRAALVSNTNNRLRFIFSKLNKRTYCRNASSWTILIKNSSNNIWISICCIQCIHNFISTIGTHVTIFHYRTYHIYNSHRTFRRINQTISIWSNTFTIVIYNCHKRMCFLCDVHMLTRNNFMCYWSKCRNTFK
ncbi:hypothetical protein D3C85_1316950 [compost metagenome]